MFSPEIYDLFGTAAAILTTFSFLPQVIKVWRTKSVKDISLFMYSIFTTGVACWLIYGFGLGSMPIIVANAITLSLAASILFMKIRYDKR